MSDPERMLSGGTDFERELLAGGVGERPTAAMSRQMAVGVGVGGAVGYTAMAKAMAATWWGKAVIGTVVGAVVATSVLVGGGDPEPAKKSETRAPAVVEQVAAPVVEAPAKPEVATVEEVTDLEEAADEEQAQPAVSRPRVKAAPKKSTLAEEIRLIDQARALVKSGKHAQALSVLNRYSQKFPAGVLKHEAGVLRNQAKQGL